MTLTTQLQKIIVAFSSIKCTQNSCEVKIMFFPLHAMKFWMGTKVIDLLFP
jgi:hypothetical protein